MEGQGCEKCRRDRHPEAAWLGIYFEPVAVIISSATLFIRGLVTVPHPKKDIKPGTLAQIGRQAGLTF